MGNLAKKANSEAGIKMRGEKRIVVIGTSGSGKSTLAAKVAQKLSIPHIEMDALYWEPNWQEAPEETLRERVKAKMELPEWVVDGNYNKVRDLVWTKATMLVWLDFSKSVVMRRLLIRTVKRAVFRQKLWNGNQENFRLSFFSRDSVLYWGWVTHSQLKEKYQPIFEQAANGASEYSQIAFVRLPNPKAAEQWLTGLELE